MTRNALRTAPETVTATTGIARMHVNVTAEPLDLGYVYYHKEVATLTVEPTGQVASAVRGATGLHAPALDVDLPVTVEPINGSLSRITITVATHGWKVRQVQRALARAGLVDWTRRGGNGARRFGPRGLTPVGEVVLDVAAPVRLVRSSPGRHHVFIDHAMSARTYKRLLRALTRAGIIERQWAFGAPGWTSVASPQDPDRR